MLQGFTQSYKIIDVKLNLFLFIYFICLNTSRRGSKGWREKDVINGEQTCL